MLNSTGFLHYREYPLGTLAQVRVAIIGSGFAGLGMAIQLTRRGIDDFVVIERAGEVGGTWRGNTYPGATCEIQSDLYSYSFAPAFDGKYRYGRQPEIFEYLRSTAGRYGIRPRIRFDTELEDATWDASAPVWPLIPGLEQFAGERFHSSRWRHDIDPSSPRGAAIGTGASAIQFVPEVQKVVGELTVSQRTPPWMVPRGDAPTTR